MDFEPQNELERVLVEATTDVAARPRFYEVLMESTLYIIEHGVEPSQESATRMLEEGYTLTIQPIEHNGRVYLPVFSSPQRIAAVVQQQVQTIGMKARELMTITRGSNLVLNPGSGYGKELLEEEIAALLDGAPQQGYQRQTFTEETQVMIGKAAVYPQELADALTKAFKEIKEVRKAYLAHYIIPSQHQKAHSLVALEIDGDWDEVMARVLPAVEGVHVPDPPVDFMQLSDLGGINDYFKNDKPFYRRRMLGIL